MTAIATRAADRATRDHGSVVRAVLRQHRTVRLPLCHRLLGQMGADSWIRSKYVGVNILPFLACMFLGAPLIASDFETGAFRFSITQGLSIRRQIARKLLVLGAALAVAAAALGALSLPGRTDASPRARQARC
jgi:hypothetical protein